MNSPQVIEQELNEQGVAIIPAASESAAVLDMILRAAKDPATDIEKVDRLMGMYQRERALMAEQAYSVAMCKAQAEIPKIFRNKKNLQNDARYADLEAINEIVVPIATKHGFSLNYSTADSPLAGHYRIVCRVRHEAGHSDPHVVDVPADLAGMKGTPNKTPTQAFGSTMSYGRRYLVLLIFNISLTNEDNDGQGGSGYERISEQQVADLRALMQEVSAKEAPLLFVLGCDKIEDINVASYRMAVSMVEAKRKQADRKVMR